MWSIVPVLAGIMENGGGRGGEQGGGCAGGVVEEVPT